MQRDARAFLWDVREAAVAIQSFIAGIDFPDYADSPLLHSAVERKFEIIGEALNQLARLDPVLALRIPETAQIVAFRNLLIHGYAVVEHGRVWRVARESLPGLLARVDALLVELDWK
jgi:uncharacterized protein with HEPN domain